MSEEPGYGLWTLVIVNSVIFILFAYTFFKPRTGRDWRSFGAFSAFLVALFTEMYGFPLTIYLLSGWLQTHYPGVDWFSHDAGHLLEMLFGLKTNPHAGPFHILSYIFIGGGFILISVGWKVLYDAQQQHRLATSGIYAYIRHPQYVGFIAVMFGFLLQWPTLLSSLCSQFWSSCTRGWRAPRNERLWPNSATPTRCTWRACRGLTRGSPISSADRCKNIPDATD
jgi:protein-S-isoprenylcysteine O-methyltransferase Ste14